MLKINVFLSFISVLILAGCCHTNTIVKEVPPCVENIENYFHDCGQPTAITNGITYEQMIDAMKKDRDSLQLCINENEKISNTLKQCDIQIKKFNADAKNLKNNN